MTLLDKAKAAPRGIRPKVVTPEFLEKVDLVIAFYEGHITRMQFAAAIECDQHNVANHYKVILDQALRMGIVRIVRA